MIRANSSDKKRVVEILSKAFIDNKSVNYVVKQDKHTIKRINRLMKYSFEVCRLAGEIYLSDDKNSVALLKHSKNKRTSIRIIWEELMLVLFSIGITRVLKILKREKYLEKARPKIEYLYFWFFGTMPDCQGKGAAKQLSDEIFELVDKKSLPICVETSGNKQKNVYTRHGFKNYHTYKFNNSDFDTYFLIRDPNK